VARDLRNPVGPFKPMKKITPARRRGLIDAIAALPDELVWEVDSLTKDQLNTPYREGGWTLRQVVHHIADSHTHAYVRMRLAVTEKNPKIKAYDQERWAELRDSTSAPIDLSIQLIDALHRRWAWWLNRLDPQNFERTLQHPDHGSISVDFLLQLYAWHGRHHLGHIKGFTERMGW
jgi:uncharacterized damage-inducible protein DinB